MYHLAAKLTIKPVAVRWLARLVCCGYAALSLQLSLHLRFKS